MIASATAMVWLLFGAVGCGQSKIAECNSLIEVLNKGAQDIDKGTKAVAANPMATGEYKQLADSADKVAESASKVELKINELKKFSSDYQAVMKEFAKTARDTAAAVEAKDTAKMTAAANAMERVGKQEESLINDINKFCQAP
jgi:methyl-accepting chemotaxis protein